MLKKDTKTVFSAVTNDISSDERVNKTCNYLISKNFKLTVYGRVLENTFEIKREYKIIRKKHFFNHNFLFYAEYNIRLFFHLIFKKYDYILSNDLDTLPACFLASKIIKAELVYDSHEYYTETPELQGRKFVQKFWLTIEQFFLPKIKKCYTVSESIAKTYNKLYAVNMGVIRNLPMINRKIHQQNVSFPTKNKVVLYQGVLNPGRGIKPMIKALHFLKNVDFAIIGYGKVKDELIQFAKSEGLEDRVIFMGRIAHEELPNYTKIADIGIVLEEPLGKSFEFSLPNKLFDYIHAEIPIVTSSLIEVKKIVELHNIGVIVSDHNPLSIAKEIQLLLDNNETVDKIIENQKIAKLKLCWENEQKLLDIYFT